MAIKVYKLPENEINTQKVINGQVIYDTTNRIVYFDNVDGTRMIASGIKPLKSDFERDKFTDPEPDKVYLVLSTCKIYKYAGEWVELKEPYEIIETIFNPTILLPIVMNENGVDVAPATIASNVFTDEGSTVESLLAQILYSINNDSIRNKLKTETSTVKLFAGQDRILPIYPREKFLENGNIFIFYINDKPISNLNFSMDGDYVQLHDFEVEPDSIATFVFFYTESNFIADKKINGSLITPYSIPTSRLQSVSDKIDLNNGNYLASSKAIYNLTQQVDSLVKNGNPVITTKMATAISDVNVVSDGQVRFKIPYPFDNYNVPGNSFIVFCGSLFIHPDRYIINTDPLIPGEFIVINGIYPTKGDLITFVFFYNTSSGNGALNPDGSPIYEENTRFREINFNNEGYVDIAYGNGLFVTISNTYSSEMICTTPDGEEWTKHIMNIHNIWMSVCYGNDTFVAVGYNNEGLNCVTISKNGTEWESVPASDNSSKWFDITYGNKTFVAIAEVSVSNRQTIMISTNNGYTWIPITSPISESPRKIIYGNNNFVILTDNYILISENGISWNLVNKSIDDICYKDGRYFYIKKNEDKYYFGYTKDFIEFLDSELGPEHHPTQIYSTDNLIYIFEENSGISNKILITDGFNMMDDIIVESRYEYNKFRFAYGNGLMIGIKPDRNVAILSGKPTIPELYKILNK